MGIGLGTLFAVAFGTLEFWENVFGREATAPVEIERDYAGILVKNIWIGLYEEAVFRLFFFLALTDIFGHPELFLALSSVLFAVVHYKYGLPKIPNGITMGICLGLIAWYYGFWAAVGAHYALDFYVSVFSLKPWRVEMPAITEPLRGKDIWRLLIFTGVLGVVLGYLMSPISPADVYGATYIRSADLFFDILINNLAVFSLLVVGALIPGVTLFVWTYNIIMITRMLKYVGIPLALFLHGIYEIGALVLGAYAGVYGGRIIWHRIYRRREDYEIEQFPLMESILSGAFLMFVAAILEAFYTTALLGL